MFHYVSWDSFHGIVVCPSDGDVPLTGGPVHAEVLNTFHKTCLSMRRLFSPYYKQVSSKLGIYLLYGAKLLRLWSELTFGRSESSGGEMTMGRSDRKTISKYNYTALIYNN